MYNSGSSTGMLDPPFPPLITFRFWQQITWNKYRKGFEGSKGIDKTGFDKTATRLT